MEDVLQIQKSSSDNMYEALKTIRPDIVNPNVGDLYMIILNLRDSEKLINQTSSPKLIKKKVTDYLKTDVNEDLVVAFKKFGEAHGGAFSKDAEHDILTLLEFIEIFCDMHQILTSSEANDIFNELNSTSKAPQSPPRIRISKKAIFEYFCDGQKAGNKEDRNKAKDINPKDLQVKTDKDKSKDVLNDKDPDKSYPSKIAEIEDRANVYIPIIFNTFEKTVKIKELNTVGYIKPYFTKLSAEDLQQVKDELMVGSKKHKTKEYSELNFKSFTQNVRKLTTYKQSNDDYDEKLKAAIERYKKANPEMVTDKDKDILNSILQIEHDSKHEYMKYDLITTYYDDSRTYQKYAETLKTSSKPSDKEYKTITMGSIDKESDDPRGKEDQKADEKKLKPGLGLGGLGIGGNKEEDKNNLPSARSSNILGMLKDEINDINSLRDKIKQDGSAMTQKELEQEGKEFNKLISKFIKNYNEINTDANISETIEIVSNFLFKNNGSSKIREARNEGSMDSVDILDFWRDIDEWHQLKFSEKGFSKFIFCFMKLNVSNFMVNLKELEHQYNKITAKNKLVKIEQIRSQIKVVREEILAKSGNKDQDKSVELEYGATIKDGKKMIKGSTEELIHKIIEYVDEVQNRKKLFNEFKKHMDGQNEITEKQFKVILDTLKIENTSTQRKNIFKLVDTDNDVMMDFAELEKFLSDYDRDQELMTNILKKGSKSKGMAKMIQEVCKVNMELNDDDYYDKSKYTTILNSDTAALKRIVQLLDEVDKQKDKKYFDVEFGPKDKNDVEGSRMALYAKGDAPPGYIKPEQIDWYTPLEYAGEGCEFSKEEASSNEVIQGALGDCWFIGALSVLASRDELLIGGLNQYDINNDFEVTESIAKTMAEGVYPPIFKSYERTGLYVFRFFKDFSWRYVIIDDRIPCYKSNKQPVFGRCSDIKELWVPLIEKAYAKLHMCYESLVSGFIDDGLTDLTGFVAEKLNLHDKNGVFPNKKLGTEDQFWDYLKERRVEESMLGCARKDDTVEGPVIIDGEPTGILSRHAYGLLDVIEIDHKNKKDKIRLLRIRNPWGKSEWVGEWSDRSEEIEEYKEELQAYVNSLESDEQFEIGAEDGTFFIDYENWSTIYNKLYVTIDFPESWSGMRFTHKWNEKNAGGLPMPSAGMSQKEATVSWAKNPQFLIKQNLDQDVEVFISLAQNDGRKVRGTKFPFPEQIHPVCVMIYPSKDGNKATEFNGKIVKGEWVSAVVEHKEVSLRATLPQGNYLVVPGTREPNSFGDFYLSIYFNAEINDIEIKNLQDPKNKGIEIKEEDEDVEVSEFRKQIVTSRIDDLKPENMNKSANRLTKLGSK